MVTGKEIIERLGMHPTSIQSRKEFTPEDLIRFLADRRKPAGAWRPEKAALADAWYCELTGDTPLPTEAAKPRSDESGIIPQPPPAAPPQKPSPTSTLPKPANTEKAPQNANLDASQNFLRSEGFTIVMLIIAIVAQTLHTATFFYFLTPVPDSILRYVTAAVVGIGVDAAALVATIQSQKKWYLWAFAGIHFGINMSAHFRFADSFGDLDTTTYHFWFDSALLSGAVAFAVYCYSNVFAFKK